MPAPVPFVSHVRHALAHLYDPDVLRTHPLLTLLGLNASANPQATLRDALLSAIESLRPAASVPVTSRTWRVYKVLQCRYVQQMDQQQTADQLGVGVRHVRREQHVAVQALADLLYETYAPRIDESLPAATTTNLGRELSWLREMGSGETTVVAVVLASAYELLLPLARARGVELAPPQLPPLPAAAIHATALRQALVSATTYAIRRCGGGRVSFRAEARGNQLLLIIQAVTGKGPLPAALADEAASLQAAATIVGMTGGHLDVKEEHAALTITLILTTSEVVDVLLIDDNADFAQLFARYVAGTRYRLQSIGSASGLFERLADHRPRIIVLDVMIPGVDGWEILGRLRQHPLTSSIPVIVCTILPERDLALALGATAYLAKPVTRQALLEALARTLDAAPPESHSQP